MQVHVMCLSCGKVLSAPQQMMGRALRCPDCDEPVPIPERPWYYRQKGAEFGPVSAPVLRWLARAGEIWPDTLVRRGDSAKWVPAGGVNGLFEATSENPPSSPERQT